MLAVGTWVAGHQTTEGVWASQVNKADLQTVNGIGTARRVSTPNFYWYVALRGVMPDSYVAGTDIECCCNFAAGASAITRHNFVGVWSRFTDGAAWSGYGTAWPIAPIDEAVAPYAVFRRTATIPNAYITPQPSQVFQVQIYWITFNPDVESHFLSCQMWVA